MEEEVTENGKVRKKGEAKVKLKRREEGDMKNEKRKDEVVEKRK